MNKIKLKFLNELPRNKFIQHLVFWGCSYYILLHLFSHDNQFEKIDQIYTSLFLISLLVGVYLNLFILIPLLLDYKRILFYIASVAVVMMLSVGVNVLTFRYLADILFPDYMFISELNFVDILKIIIVFIGITTLLELSRSYYKAVEAEKRITELEREKVQMELKALKSQINPHFLFNSLNSIYAISMKRGNEAQKAILRLSDILRYVLYETQKETVFLSKEVSFLNDYITLQKYRMENDTELDFTVEGKEHDHQIAPMLLIPLVENAFKHGLRVREHILRIVIRIEIDADELLLSVENTREDSLSDYYSSEGVGIENVRKRLILLYPGRHELNVYQYPDRFVAKLKLKL